jgi:DNA-binding response OmpR family regulator
MEQLVRFMRAHDMPLDGLDDGNTRVLVLDGDASWAATVREALNAEGGFKSMTADNAFEAGSALSEFDPHVLLLDTELTDVTPRKISRFIRSISDRQETCLIGTGFEMTEATGQALLQDGFDGYLIKPFELHELTGLIESRMPQHAGSPSSQR